MKFFNSITGRFIFIVLITLLFWLWTSLTFVDRTNRVLHYTDVSNSFTEMIETSARINMAVLRLENMAASGSLPAADFSTDRLEQEGMDLRTFLRGLEQEEEIGRNASFQRNIRILEESTNELLRTTNKYISLLQERGSISQGLLQRISERLSYWDKTGDKSFDGFISDFRQAYGRYLTTMNPDIVEELIDRWNTNRAVILSGIVQPVRYSTISLDVNQARNELESDLRLAQNLISIDQKLGYFHHTGLTADLQLYSGQIHDNLNDLYTGYQTASMAKSRRLSWSLLYIFLFAGTALLLLLYYFSRSAMHAFSTIRASLRSLGRGKIPEKMSGIHEVEFADIAEQINTYADSLKAKIEYSRIIGESNPEDGSFRFPQDDALGVALNNLAGKLAEAREEDRLHQSEEEKRRWTSEGLALFGDIFRTHNENVRELAFSVLQNLVSYVGASLGNLYIRPDDDREPPVYRMAASFAYDRRKYLEKDIFPGEGLVGTCIIEKEPIFLTDIPETYIEISSGFGEAPPRCLLLVPLKIDDDVFGVIEIASFRILKAFEISFAEQLGESIASTLATVRINEKTTRLLQQSREQAQEMALQEEKMRTNMQALERAQEESQQKESEMEGILNAVSSSSLVAEFTMSGRFAEVNDKYVLLLDSPRDGIIGRHHSDFAVADKYSDAYRQFWNRLRAGDIISVKEKFKLFSGQEIWLQQTYTPIRDKDRKPFKILSIAIDITQSVAQQEALKQQADEITRKSLEMQSLSEAVDLSLIKCDYDPEGIILSMNMNYNDITGYSKKELIGKNNRLFLREMEKEQFDSIMQEVLKDKVYTGVIRRTKPTGEEVWLMANFTPVKNEDGLIYKVYFMAQDITEKKLRYQLLEEANKEVERLRSRINEMEKN
ncbi:MAG TPA: PAS domain S-box protein [Bacteroidales bacterium]|nr:PAS domain S-box protein [Bacteroidales bacterium]